MLDEKKRCRHFNGLRMASEEGKTRCCDAGLRYHDVMRVEELGATGSGLRLPCHGESGTVRGQPVTPCETYETFTDEELAERKRDLDRRIARVQKGMSPCCDAALDTSHVITEGHHKGHGPRFCSACKKLAFMV